jgi:uncharacterized protein with ParB-like and HNH nuclease domain
MDAKQLELDKLLYDRCQYEIPQFQRHYAWTDKQWKVLWEDLTRLLDDPNPERKHFFGSVVTQRIPTAPGQIQRYHLVDGQQRFTTVQLVLLALRARVQQDPTTDLTLEEIDEYLKNKRELKPTDQKLLPSEPDRKVYRQLLDSQEPDEHKNSLIAQCYQSFTNWLRTVPSLSLKQVFTALMYRFSVVSITLDQADDPHGVFESLNFKGTPLAISDLLRNLLFMKTPKDQEERLYTHYWQPLEERLTDPDKGVDKKTNSKKTDHLSNFFQHFCSSRQGRSVPERAIYPTFRDEFVSDKSPEEMEGVFQELTRYSEYYERLLFPDKERESVLRAALQRLEQLRQTTHYPLLLSLYAAYTDQELTADELAECIWLLEVFWVRRILAGKESSGLNKEFPGMFRKLANIREESDGESFLQALKTVLASHSVPDDSTIRETLPKLKLYGTKYANFILYSLECQLSGKEVVANTQDITIEHIAPQSPIDAWKNAFADLNDEEYKAIIHTIGNLTLTGKNSKLSNHSFEVKRKELQTSNLGLNRYFTGSEIQDWNAEAIRQRSEHLARLAVERWPDFKQRSARSVSDYTGKKPLAVVFDAHRLELSGPTWRACLIAVVEWIWRERPEGFDKLRNAYPHYFLNSRPPARKEGQYQEIANDCFLYINLSAEATVNWCKKYLELAGVDATDFTVDCTG